jgi:putative acetyltransferase
VIANVSAPALRVRPYVEADEDEAIELWQRSWQQAYPDIDFAERVVWWRERWRNELVRQTQILVAEMDDVLEGFVTIDPKTGYLDQIVVAPEAWGTDVATMLMAEARRISPNGLDLKVNADNVRAIRFYEKQGFVDAGETVNEISGAPVRLMRWRP